MLLAVCSSPCMRACACMPVHACTDMCAGVCACERVYVMAGLNRYISTDRLDKD